MRCRNYRRGFNSEAYCEAIASQEKYFLYAARLRSANLAWYSLSPRTRTKASPKAVSFPPGTSTTPASVIGAAVSLPAKAITGRPQAMPAMRLLRRSEEHTSELQSLRHLVCRLLLEKKKHTLLNTQR